MREFAPHAAWVRSLAVTSDGRHVVSASEDRTLKVSDLVTGRELAQSGADLPLMTAVLGPNDRIVAGDSRGGVLTVELG